MRKEKDYLKTARNISIITLLWAVCTVNPFLIIAAILSWTADSNKNIKVAKGARICYIAGGITSSLFTLSITLLGNIISIFSGLSKIAGGAFTIIAATVIADIFIAGAAVLTKKGVIQLEKTERKKIEASQSVGLFSNEMYTSDDSDKN